LAVHSLFLFHPTTTTEISTLSLHDALPISVNWITEDVGDDVDVERFKFTGQVSLTREIGGRLGLAAVPSILFNPDELEEGENPLDRKSTRLNSSHVKISYAVFCLKKKKQRI